MGPSVSWDPWPRPVARAAVVTQECTQIGENGLSTLVWGTCVHYCAVADNRGYAGVYTDRLKWPLGAGLGRSCTLLRRDSPRRRPTQIPEEPILRGIYSWLRGLGLDRIALRGKVQAKVGASSHPDRDSPTAAAHHGRGRPRPCPAEVCMTGRGVQGPRDGGGCPYSPSASSSLAVFSTCTSISLAFLPIMDLKPNSPKVTVLIASFTTAFVTPASWFF